MDKDEFEAWRDSPATQAVFAYLREQADAREARGGKFLWGSAVGSGQEQWHRNQIEAAYMRGRVEGLREVLGLEHDTLTEDTE